MDDYIPPDELVRQRLLHEEEEVNAKRATNLQKHDELCEKIRATAQLLVLELDRLGWPDATLQDRANMRGPALYAITHDISVSPKGELYTLPYLGDGEYASRWQRTSIESLSSGGALMLTLGNLESHLNTLRSR